MKTLLLASILTLFGSPLCFAEDKGLFPHNTAGTLRLKKEIDIPWESTAKPRVTPLEVFSGSSQKGQEVSRCEIREVLTPSKKLDQMSGRKNEDIRLKMGVSLKILTGKETTYLESLGNEWVLLHEKSKTYLGLTCEVPGKPKPSIEDVKGLLSDLFEFSVRKSVKVLD